MTSFHKCNFEHIQQKEKSKFIKHTKVHLFVGLMPIIVKTIAHFLLFSPNFFVYVPSKFNRIKFCDCILVSKSSELS